MVGAFMNRSITRSLWTGVPLLAVLWIGAGCDKDATAGPAPAAGRPTTQPVTVRVAPVDRQPIPDTVDFVGTLYGDEDAQIASKVTGRIVAVRADLGDRLDDGQVLAEVDPTDYRLLIDQRELALREALAMLGLDALPEGDFDVTQIATVRRADVQAQNAQARLDRAKQLFDQTPPLISAQEYADTQTQLEVARRDYDVAVLEARTSLAQAKSRAAEVELARQQLADTFIRAPRASTESASPSGRWAVAARMTSVGEYVQAGTVVFRVIADRPIKLRTSVPERFIGRVRSGQDVTLKVDALADPVQGSVSRVSPAVDVASRTFAVEVTFANAERQLKPGTFGRGAITVGERSDVTTIPAAALYSFAGLDRVFSIKDGKAVANAVSVVVRDPDRVVIEGDLGGATQVAVSGLARLAKDVPVIIDTGVPTTAPTTAPVTAPANPSTRAQ
jgi:RND family efflux transporter MFP subunit